MTKRRLLSSACDSANGGTQPDGITSINRIRSGKENKQVEEEKKEEEQDKLICALFFSRESANDERSANRSGLVFSFPRSTIS